MEKVEQLQNLRSAFTKNIVAELLLRFVLFVSDTSPKFKIEENFNI